MFLMFLFLWLLQMTRSIPVKPTEQTDPRGGECPLLTFLSLPVQLVSVEEGGGGMRYVAAL